MKAKTIVTLKKELHHRSQGDILQLCLRLARFKKENKELLSYLLFEAHDEDAYILNIKNEIDEQFKTINTDSYFYIKKSVRKILRTIKKYARYSQKKETEAELLLYFCEKLYYMKPSITHNKVLTNILNRQLALIEKIVSKFHEDLQYDFNLKLDTFKKHK